MSDSTKVAVWGGVVLVLALMVNLGLGLRLGLAKPVISDSKYFLECAKNLALGKGYVSEATFWPGQRTMRRMPGWPFLVSIGMRIFPFLPPDRTIRLTSLVVNALAAMMIYMLTSELFRRLSAALIAGIAYTLHPTALYVAYNALSEPLFVLLVAFGIWLMVKRRKESVRDNDRSWTNPMFRLGSAWFVLGLACLVRANFILFLPSLVAITSITWFLKRRNRANGKGTPSNQPMHALRAARMLAGLLYLIPFIAPPMAWALRNRAICGEFPVLSTLRGQTFYGGNNAVVANTLEFWGYWVFPDAIPGQTPMATLAQTMSEHEVDAYYYEKGWAFVRENWFGMPRLLLGKLIRTYVPVPWKPAWPTYLASAYRWVMFFTAVAGLMLAWGATPLGYRSALIAMTLTNVVTVLLFWGYARFAFALEPFFLPFVGYATGLIGGALARKMGRPSAADNSPSTTGASVTDDQAMQCQQSPPAIPTRLSVAF